MEAFRQPEVFSSAATVDTLAMGSVRPLIPLQIDPPDHLKYRKILDPLFAPRQMAALDEPVAALVNDLIDGFVDRGEVDFAQRVLGAVAVAGVPHAARPAAGRAARAVPEDEGRHHPARPRHRQAARRRRDARLPERDRRSRSTTTSTRCSTSARSSAATTCSASSSTPRSTGSGCTPRGHPRHLLPLLHRRPRHRDRLARLLLRLPARAPRAARSSSSPIRRSCPSAVEELLRWETPVSAASCASPPRTPSSSGCPIKQGDMVSISLGVGRHRRGRAARRVRRALRPRGEPATSRSAAACTAASARTSRASSCASRCASGTAASPSTRSSRPRAGVHAGDPLARDVPDGVHRQVSTRLSVFTAR